MPARCPQRCVSPPRSPCCRFSGLRCTNTAVRGGLKGRMAIKYRFLNPVFIKRQRLQMGWAESKPQVFSKTSPFLSWFGASPISSCRRVTWNLGFLIEDKGKIIFSAQHVQTLLFRVCFFKSLIHLKDSLDALFKYFLTKAL